jgi:hypothetical protein
VKSMGKCSKDECIYLEGFSLRGSKRQPGDTDNRSSLTWPHKRSGDNMDYNLVFEIASGILIAFAIGWVLLRYGLYAAIMMLFVYIVMLILRILRG